MPNFPEKNEVFGLRKSKALTPRNVLAFGQNLQATPKRRWLAVLARNAMQSIWYAHRVHMHARHAYQPKLPGNFGMQGVAFGVAFGVPCTHANQFRPDPPKKQAICQVFLRRNCNKKTSTRQY
jgi:hypothetical protein